MSEDLVSVLAESKLFSGFNQDQLKDVMLFLQPKAITLQRRDLVYVVGETADRCWLIQSGNLMARRTSVLTPFHHMIYHKGSVTGIQGLVDPGSKRAVSMIAEDEVHLVEITHEGISRLDNETQILFWKNVSRLLLRKLSICLSRESLNN